MSNSAIIRNSLLLSVMMFSVITQVSAQDYGVIFEPVVELPEIAVGSPGTHNKDSVNNKRRIVNRLSLTSGGSAKLGVLRYRGEKGKFQYGIGYKRLVAGNAYNAIVTRKGLMLATEKNDVLYNLHVRSEDPQTGLESTYIQFSLMRQW